MKTLKTDDSPNSKLLPVPCNGCTRCCRGDAVRILPGEDQSKWKTEPHQNLRNTRMLAHDANGDCIYLQNDGCSIWDHRPEMCQSMDCRNIFDAFTYTKARKLSRRNRVRLSVWLKGKELRRAEK